MNLFSTLIPLAVCLCLSACGGGGGAVKPSAPTFNPVQVPGTSATADLVLEGTVATGLAAAGAAVTAKCWDGTGVTIADSSGTYRLSVVKGQGPCVVEAALPGSGGVLHAVALPTTGAGTPTVANVTPLTEMVAARLLRQSPAQHFAQGQADTLANQVTAVALQNAQIDVGNALRELANFHQIGDWGSTRLAAATAAAPQSGDAHDKLLDLLMARLTPENFKKMVAALATEAQIVNVRAPFTTAVALPTGGTTRTYLTPWPRRINNLPDTDVGLLDNEPALAFWPMVAGIGTIGRGEVQPIVAAEFPQGVFPIRFASFELNQTIGGATAKSGYKNDNSCTLNLVGDQLVVEVDGRRFQVTMDGLPLPDPNVITPLGSGEGFIASAGLRTVMTTAITRHLEIRVQNPKTLIDPNYGPFEAGTSIGISATYDRFSVFGPTQVQMSVRETFAVDPQLTVGWPPFQSNTYTCVSYAMTSAPSGPSLIPADSTIR